MTSMNIGAVKRQRVGETARRRLAALLPAAGGGAEGAAEESAARVAGGAAGAAEPSATGPPGGSPLGGGLGGGSGDVPSAPVDGPAGGAGFDGVPPYGVPSDDDGSADPGRAPFRFGPAVMLDRRAVSGLVVLLLLAVGYGVQHFWLARPQPVAVPAVAVPAPAVAPAEPGASPPSTPEASAGPVPAAPGDAEARTVVVVDIGGRVHAPGVHTLPGGSRVADALRVAGGPLPETETKGLNLARVLTDGEQILVGEPDGAAQAVGGPATGAVPKQPVSLNHATLEQLDTLPGVGPTLAQRIIAFRASHGSFRSLDQLRQVSGIGERTYAELRPMLTL
ncbi:ComEA family DNA-binding protein [Kitasatospora sp. NBC_01246]|uniref:ComEA family DNA-binding protein n=1 Tax=Kitasatospora sp. NBC_01246 TaxID=2903570 RepID=UPI002E35ED88|nr:ComEA family DNA-binding protein [Kitasatospora sp. NBC_01246]